MSFKGYRYKFKLNISHALGKNKCAKDGHFHTLDIALYTEQNNDIFVSYEDVEKKVDEYMLQYSEKFLNDIPPFDVIPPTIENVGDEFYIKIKELLSKFDFSLVKLEISETPSRVYIASDMWTDDNMNDKKASAKVATLAGKINEEFSKKDYQKTDKNVEPEHEIPIDELILKLEPPVVSEEQPVKIIQPPTKSKKLLSWQLIISFTVLMACSIALVVYINVTGLYPLGFDVYGHIFKADFLYDSIKSGDFYPLYTNSWYNGIQPFRYWAPLPYYLLAFMEFLTGGDVMAAFLITIGVIFFVGAIGWVLFGIKHDRIILCTVLGILWFFLPDNARVFFSEGNFPRMVIAMIIPYLVYFIWDFVEYKNKKSIFLIMLFTALITLCHAMLGAMVGIAAFVFLLFYSIADKHIKESVQVIIGMLLSFAICGIWLYPALSGGITSMSSTDIMTSLSSEISESLDFFNRIKGNVGTYYFGIVIFVISVLGIFISNKKSAPGFLTAIMFLLGTTPVLTAVIVKLPLSNVLWMRRFTLISYALCFLSMVEWKKLKKAFVIVFCIAIAIDCVPSFNLEEHIKKFSIPVTASTQEQYAQQYSFSTAKAITNQRISVMDLSFLGPFLSYYFCTGEDAVQYSFGWAWQGATTANNIVLLNTALEKEYFNYMFDRSIEMGDDTVIIRKRQFKQLGVAFPLIEKAAALNGYELVENGKYCYVYHKITPETFGVVTNYKKYAIGTSATEISLMFPSFEKGDSIVLDEYTFDELKGYEEIYLSGFTYKDKAAAENLVSDLTESGIKVIIDMNRIPQNEISGRSDFMGVVAQPITFDNSYPDLIYNDSIFESTGFNEEYEVWNTIYLENVNTPTGYAWFEDEKLSYLGTGENENTVFMGFNLLFHAMETNDPELVELVNDILNVTEDLLPKREVTEYSIVYEKDKIIIDSPCDNLNTTIAYQDNFKSNSEIINFNNLLVVNKGRTEINIVYPYLKQGILVSLAGFVSSAIFIYCIFRKKKQRHISIWH